MAILRKIVMRWANHYLHVFAIFVVSHNGFRVVLIVPALIHCLLEKVPQDLFHSVYFEYEENSTHDRLLSLNYAFCHIKRLIKTSEPVYTG